jgi:sulfite exporter TauE/SafE
MPHRRRALARRTAVPIDWLTIGAALLSGLLGSAHCAAMCGGIATSFSLYSPRKDGASTFSRAWLPAIETNFGRVGGYALAGAMAGGVGSGIVRIARLEWLALGLRVLAGVVLIVVAVRLLNRGRRVGFLDAAGRGVWSTLRPLQRHLLPANGHARRIGLGALWGWMPCGLSTTMLLAAWLQATALNGALTMTAFGLGTLPLMLSISASGARLGHWIERPARRQAVASIVLLAGAVTIASPWLIHASSLHGVLAALGCLPTTD